jgi:hypothetical protein
MGSARRKRLVRHRSEMDGYFRTLPGQALARAEIKGNTLPTPVVDEQL